MSHFLSAVGSHSLVLVQGVLVHFFKLIEIISRSSLDISMRKSAHLTLLQPNAVLSKNYALSASQWPDSSIYEVETG